MAVMTTGNHPKHLWPGVNKFFGLSYKQHPEFWKDIFDVSTSKKKYEEDVLNTGFGQFAVKDEANGVTFDSMSEGYTKRYTHVVYGSGFIVSEEAIEDDQYESVATRGAKELGRAASTTLNTLGAQVLDRAFNSSYTGGDGKELCATDHPTKYGDQSNELTTAADLSEASLEDLLINISGARDDRGNQMALQGRCLIVPRQEIFNAERILRSALRVDVANNDLNAIRSLGLLPDGIKMNPYLTDADAWFIKTDIPMGRGMRCFMRRPLKFAQDDDFNTGNAKAKATFRTSFGWSDWRHMYGTPGA